MVVTSHYIRRQFSQLQHFSTPRLTQALSRLDRMTSSRPLMSFRFGITSLLIVTASTIICLTQYRKFVGSASIAGGVVRMNMNQGYIDRACSEYPFFVQRFIGPTGGGMPLSEHAHFSITVPAAIFICLTQLAFWCVVIACARLVIQRTMATISNKAQAFEKNESRRG